MTGRTGISPRVGSRIERSGAASFFVFEETDGDVFSAALGRAHVFVLKSRNHARRANAGEAGRKE
jgi:hypothetical protein